MKKLLAFLLCLILAHYAFGQKRKTITDTVGSRTQKHEEEVVGNHIWVEGFSFNKESKRWVTMSFGINDNAIDNIFTMLNLNEHQIDSLQRLHPKAFYPQMRIKNKIILALKLSPATGNFASADKLASNTKSYSVHRLSDSSTADLMALGIDASNVNDYRYHVVANDSTEIVPWRVPQLQQKFGAKKPYGFLGHYKGLDKQLVIEVVNIKDYSLRDGMVLDWRTNLKPVVTDIFTDNEEDEKTIFNYTTKFDKVTGLPLDLKLPLDILQGLNFSIRFKSHETVGYNIFVEKEQLGKKSEPVLMGQTNEDDYIVDTKKYITSPGDYQLLIQPIKAPFNWDEKQITYIKFKVLPSAVHAKQFTIKQILPFLIAGLLIVSLIFAGYYLFNKRRLRKAAQQKDIANLKLNSVRAQLNPHFMFNALTSIQNLMNQHDQEGANHYLAKFANLTRQILKSSGNELISLDDELRIIDDYLQMEKLRFGFNYSIEVDKTISRANTEVPAMLLQPFIENAAKHGVSVLKADGKIEIVIAKQNNDLIFTIRDNGIGFEKTKTGENGFGLKLSRDRVQLLNQIYKDQHIDLQINSSATGTEIKITLTNWA